MGARAPRAARWAGKKGKKIRGGDEEMRGRGGGEQGGGRGLGGWEKVLDRTGGGGLGWRGEFWVEWMRGIGGKDRVT